MNADPPLNSELPLSQRRTAMWPKPWGNFFAQIVIALMGWKASYSGTKTHDFGTINAHSQATTTVTVTGARSGDAAQVSIVTPTSGIIADGYVSAVDTVTIRAHNYTAGNIDPAESVYVVTVLRA